MDKYRNTDVYRADSPSQGEIDRPLVDRFGRVHTSLRVSVTDRCNIRCSYCMPAGQVVFRPRQELLTFEEIARLVRVAVTVGIRKLRITGGEPLVRADLPRLVEMLSALDGIEDLALTTNGMLLADLAEPLRAAGLRRVNISLDALDEGVFRQITRGDGLDQVLEGISSACRAGFDSVKLNAVAVAGLNESEIVPLGRFARQHDLPLRFIEFMPLNASGDWHEADVLTGEVIRTRLEAAFGPLVPEPRPDPSPPAVNYRFADGRGRLGLIQSVSQPFCEHCNRLRLTAEGQLHNCLFSERGWDARAILRTGKGDSQLRQLMQDCVLAKHASHGIGDEDFQKPRRAMHQIGG